MVTRTDTEQRLEIALESLRLMLTDLPEVAAEWADLADLEQASWSLDWDHLVGTHLVLLDRHEKAGAMTPSQAKRYRELLESLARALPLIARLGLYPPPSHLFTST